MSCAAHNTANIANIIGQNAHDESTSTDVQDVTAEETHAQLKRMRKRKRPDEAGIVLELRVASGGEIAIALAELFTSICLENPNPCFG